MDYIPLKCYNCPCDASDYEKGIPNCILPIDVECDKEDRFDTEEERSNE